MSERLIKVIELMLCRIYYLAIASLDSQYPRRNRILLEHDAYTRGAHSIFVWYMRQMAALSVLRLKFSRMQHGSVSSKFRNVALTTEKSLSEGILRFLTVSWIVSRTVFDVRTFLKQMEFIIEVAPLDPIRSLQELYDLAQTISEASSTLSADNAHDGDMVSSRFVGKFSPF